MGVAQRERCCRSLGAASRTPEQPSTTEQRARLRFQAPPPSTFQSMSGERSGASLGIEFAPPCVLRIDTERRRSRDAEQE